jgi:hypothetical protein
VSGSNGNPGKSNRSVSDQHLRDPSSTAVNVEMPRLESFVPSIHVEDENEDMETSEDTSDYRMALTIDSSEIDMLLHNFLRQTRGT